jgi:hypothetical protein
MPQRTPLQSVVVFRNKESMTPEIGKPFEFTDEEVEHIEQANPAALSDVIVTPVAEVDRKAKASKAKAAAAGGNEDI